MLSFLLIVLVSAILFLLFWGLYKVFFEEKVQARENIQQTLAQLKHVDQAATAPQSKTLLKPKIGNDKPKTKQLELKLERANLLLRPSEFIAIAIAAFSGIFLCAWFITGNILLSILSALLGYGLPFLYLHLRIWLRMKKADNEFPTILDAIVNCFKTGYGFSRSVQLISQNYQDPWGTEFGKLSVEMNLGNQLPDVLNNLKKRIPTVDVELFASAILIQKETGGNLAEILSTLSKTCRERHKLLRKVSALTAQGKLSAGVVSLVPVLIFCIMNSVVHNEVVAFLTNPFGSLLMGIAVLWMLCGIGVLFKMVQLEV